MPTLGQTNQIELLDYAAYDKNGFVYSIAPPSTKPATSEPVKFIADQQALKKFVDELTFMRYSIKGNWLHVLSDNGFTSDAAQSDNQLGGKPYSDNNTKALIIKLITEEKLAIFPTSEWLPPAARNHHQPPKPSSSETDAATPMPRPSLGPEENHVPDNWIDLDYQYADGTGVKGAQYTVKSQAGSLLSTGTLDAQGKSHVELPVHERQVTVDFHYDPADVKILINTKPKPINASSGWFDRMSDTVVGAWETAGDAADWTWGTLQGDFNETPTAGQIITNAAITAIPVVDQVADARDIFANLKLLVWEKKYTDYAVWVALFFTLIGLIPTLGSLLKGVLKLVWNGAGLGDLLKMFNHFMKGNGVKWLKELKSGKLDNYAKQAAEKGQQVFDAVIEALTDLKGKVPSGLSSVHEHISDSLNTLSSVKGQINKQFSKIAGELNEKIGKILAESSDEAAAGSAKGVFSRKQEAMIDGSAPKGVEKPTVSDPKLKNITKDLYKGADTKNPIGTGSTADAIREEFVTGKPVGGKFHTNKGQQYSNALNKWLRKNPNASASDRQAAQSLLKDLTDALGERK